MKKLLLASSVLAVLAGCSSAPRIPDYPCTLNVSERGKCASMQDVYEASKSAKPGVPGVQSVFDARAQEQVAQRSQPFFGQQAAPTGYTDSQPSGTPVFNQSTVHRTWVAPYTDADGVLRSGQYVYFNTPGSWNYGSLKKKGAASDIFAPANPKEKLGFNPDYNAAAQQQQNGQRAPKPASSTEGTQVVNGKAGDVTSSDGVTQPKIKFNQ